MPILTLADQSQRAEVRFIRYQDAGGKPVGQNTLVVDEIKKEPETLPHEIARLYASAESGDHWWEVETKPVMSKYEFFSMIPADARRMLRLGDVPEEVTDAAFMLGFVSEVHLNSEEATTILTWAENNATKP